MNTLEQLFPNNLRIVVPVYNTKRAALELLRHLAHLHPRLPAQTVIVDDASTDGTREALLSAFPECTVLPGTGSLLWGGGMRRGMEFALGTEATQLFWLNHDCHPAPGALEQISSLLRTPGHDCVSGYCHIAGHPEWGVNPGFIQFRDVRSLLNSPLVKVDGVNGNFVGFRTDAIRRAGLPDAQRFPHYGDGPYTLRLSRAGLGVWICSGARASLVYEIERRLSPFWRSALSSRGLFQWAGYYFGSFRSPYHLVNRWNQTVFYRGWRAPLFYSASIVSTLVQVAAGRMWAAVCPHASIASRCLSRHAGRFPLDKLRTELGLPS